MPRFRLETALHVRERLEKLYQKALAEQVQVEQQYRDRKQLMEETLNHHHKDLDEAKALESKKRAEKLLSDKGADIDMATAQAELIESLAQLELIAKLRNKR